MSLKGKTELTVKQSFPVHLNKCEVWRSHLEPILVQGACKNPQHGFAPEFYGLSTEQKACFLSAAVT